MSEHIQETYYDQGWNAYVRGEPYDTNKSLNWRDGWKDAQESVATKGFPLDMNE